MKAIHEENAKLLQTQHAFQSGIAELNKALSELKELIEVTQSLRADIRQSVTPAHLDLLHTAQ